MITAGAVVSIQGGPVSGLEIVLGEFRPRHEMPTVVSREEDAVRLVVGRDDRTADIDDGVLAQVFLVYPQNVRRRGGVRLHVIEEGEAIELAEIACFADPQDHRLEEAVETAKHLLR